MSVLGVNDTVRVFTYFFLHRLELFVVWCQVDQHGALTGAVERQVRVRTYKVRIKW